MLERNDRLREHVQNRLHAKDSPEQISYRLLIDYPDDQMMRISHETIYRCLYVQGRGGLRRELVTCLRTGRALRKTGGQLNGADDHRHGQHRRASRGGR